MISFKNLVFESVYNSEIIKEGGNTITGVDRIEKTDVKPTVDEIITQILEPEFGRISVPKQMFLLGSTGKKESSGDLDIGFDMNFSHEMHDISIQSAIGRVIDRANNVLGESAEAKINSVTFDMVHFGFPQYQPNGEKNGKTVQVDILFTHNPEFCKFYMYSPAESESAYKGAHRNDILRSIAKIMSYSIIQEDDQGKPLIWRQYDINSNGIFDDVKTIVDADGNRLKYGNTDEDLEIGYAAIQSARLITSNVREAIDLLVGESFKETDIDTFEKLFEIVKSNENFKHKSRSEDILKETAFILEENKRLAFPEELFPYVECDFTGVI